MAGANQKIPDVAALRGLLDFWFPADPADAAAMRASMRRWFGSSADEDRDLATRFGDLAGRAAAGGLDACAATPSGRLALIILLDQLPRNLHRGTPLAFAQDARALELCLEGIELAADLRLTPAERIFLYMPLQHAEKREIQQRSVAIFRALADAAAPPALTAALRSSADYAVAHYEIIERFGRFPHRNQALGRESTAAEREYLAAGGPSFGQ